MPWYDKLCTYPRRLRFANWKSANPTIRLGRPLSFSSCVPILGFLHNSCSHCHSSVPRRHVTVLFYRQRSGRFLTTMFAAFTGVDVVLFLLLMWTDRILSQLSALAGGLLRDAQRPMVVCHLLAPHQCSTHGQITVSIVEKVLLCRYPSLSCTKLAGSCRATMLTLCLASATRRSAPDCQSTRFRGRRDEGLPIPESL